MTAGTWMLAFALGAAGCGGEAPAPNAPAASATAPQAATSVPDVRRAPAGLPREGVTSGGSFTVRWAPEPDPIPVNENFELDVWLHEAATGAPVTDAAVFVQGWMPDHAHGMHLVPRVVRRDADGRYHLRGLLFHMPGHWEMTVDVVREHLAEGVTFTVDLP